MPRRAELHEVPRSAVRAGQTLFLIDPKPLEAQAASFEADLARANAQLSQALREAARLKPLAERKAIGQKEYDDAVSNGELAAASVKSAEAKLREARLSLGYTSVVAPISGLTSRAAKSEGSLVTTGPDGLLTTITQTDPMWVQFNISENERLRIDRAIAERKLSWPKDGERPMSFLAQLRLEDVASFDDDALVPHEGLLLFFASVEGGEARGRVLRASAGVEAPPIRPADPPAESPPQRLRRPANSPLHS